MTLVIRRDLARLAERGRPNCQRRFSGCPEWLLNSVRVPGNRSNIVKATSPPAYRWVPAKHLRGQVLNGCPLKNCHL